MTLLQVEVIGDSMLPTFSSGQHLSFKPLDPSTIVSDGDVVVAKHPLKLGVMVIKRVKRVENGRLFLEGDHPDPLASEDSHNFGLVSRSSVLGLWVPNQEDPDVAS